MGEPQTESGSGKSGTGAREGVHFTAGAASRGTGGGSGVGGGSGAGEVFRGRVWRSHCHVSELCVVLLQLSGRERKAREDRQRLEKEVMEVQGRVDQAEAALAQYKQLLVEQRERDSTLETQLVVVKGENAELRTEVDRNLAELERLKKCVFESGAAVDLRDSKINDLQRALSEEQQKVSLGCAAQEGLETQLSQQSAERDQLLGEKEGLEGKVSGE